MPTLAANAPYRPRNVVNAPALKQALLARSRERGDPPQLTAWLCNHFRRGLIGGFPHVLPVIGAADWQRLLPAEPVPAWLGRSELPCVFIDPQHPQLHALEQRLLEFLHAARNGPLAAKLHKITYAQALQRWHAAHARMRHQRQRGEFESRPQALRERLVTTNGRFVELVGDGDRVRGEMAYEAFHMRHCLGDFADRRTLRGGYGEHYALSVLNRERRMLSLRDARNRPHVTISLVRRDGRWVAEQVKGKQNRPPVARYHDDLVAVFAHLGIGVAGVDDCARCGLLELPGDSPQAVPRIVHLRDAADTPQARALVVQCPELLSVHPAADRATYWLALAGDADRIVQQPAPPLPVLAAALLGEAQGALPGPGEAAPPTQAPDWRAALETAVAQVPDWHYRSLNGPLRRWLHVAALDRGNALRQAMRWALASGDLATRHSGDWRYLDDAPAGGLDPARARARLRALADACHTDVDTMLRESFTCPLLRHPGFVAHCQRLDCDPLDVLVYDAAQATVTLRLALAAGVLPRARGLPLLLLNAQRLQDCCDGWRALGQAYSRGRHAVLRWRHRRHDIDYHVDRDLDAYLGQRRCNWRVLPWRQPLLAPAQLVAVLRQQCAQVAPAAT